MALSEMQNRLVVAMLDADNVQAVDFLSNKIGRPLKVYMASEVGIRQVLKQYEQNVTQSISAGERSKLFVIQQTGGTIAESEESVTSW